MKNNFDKQQTQWRGSDAEGQDKKKNIFDHIFERVLKYKNTGIYKFIYNHPMLSVLILILWGMVIIIMFFYFIYTLYKIS